MVRSAHNFEEFWPIYLRAHSRRATRAVHYLATFVGFALGGVGFALGDWRLVAGAVVIGYAIALSGHLLFEGNWPLIFPHTLWAIRSDLRMVRLAATGRLAAELEKYGVGDTANLGTS